MNIKRIQYSICLVLILSMHVTTTSMIPSRPAKEFPCNVKLLKTTIRPGTASVAVYIKQSHLHKTNRGNGSVEYIPKLLILTGLRMCKCGGGLGADGSLLGVDAPDAPVLFILRTDNIL